MSMFDPYGFGAPGYTQQMGMFGSPFSVPPQGNAPYGGSPGYGYSPYSDPYGGQNPMGVGGLLTGLGIMASPFLARNAGNIARGGASLLGRLGGAGAAAGGAAMRNPAMVRNAADVGAVLGGGALTGSILNDAFGNPIGNAIGGAAGMANNAMGGVPGNVFGAVGGAASRLGGPGAKSPMGPSGPGPQNPSFGVGPGGVGPQGAGIPGSMQGSQPGTANPIGTQGLGREALGTISHLSQAIERHLYERGYTAIDVAKDPRLQAITSNPNQVQALVLAELNAHPEESNNTEQAISNVLDRLLSGQSGFLTAGEGTSVLQQLVNRARQGQANGGVTANDPLSQYLAVAMANPQGYANLLGEFTSPLNPIGSTMNSYYNQLPSIAQGRLDANVNNQNFWTQNSRSYLNLLDALAQGAFQ